MRARSVVRLSALALATMLTASSCGLLGGDKTTLTAVFDDVGDLVTGHSVQMADVRIGSIDKIELTKDFRARVTLSIGDVDVPKRSVALLRTTSLLGEKFIELRPQGEPTKGPFLRDGDLVTRTAEAPEIEFVAEQAVKVLGGIVANDVAALVDTGAVAFGGRGADLRRLIDDVNTFVGGLADSTSEITGIIDGLDQATRTLADGDDALSGLLVNLADTTRVLSDNRERIVGALGQLSRLARVQNEEVFEPYLAAVDRQVKQADAVLERVAAGSAEVTNLVDWLDSFIYTLPSGAPRDYAQVYLWAVPQPLDPRTAGQH